LKTTLKKLEKGRRLEKEISLLVHQNTIPVLCYPLALRRLGLGQVDLACIKTLEKGNRWLEIIEVKNSGGVSYSQQKRLRLTQDFLSRVFHLPSRLCYHINR
jgi:hypothetical protein